VVRVDIPETKYAVVGDCDIAYKVLGHGSVDLLYFAGLGSHVELLWDYEPLAEFFTRVATFARVIVFDRRGAGASHAIPEGELSTWDAWVDDALAVMDAVGTARVAVFAEADAGPTAILLAAAHPERVSALVLANTAARYLAAEDYPFGVPEAAVEVLLAGVRVAWGTVDAVRAVQPDADADLAASIARMLRCSVTPRTAAAQYGHILRTTDVRDVLGLVQAPTLILQSHGQPVVSVEHARYLADGISGSKLVELPAEAAYFTPRGYHRILDEVGEFLTGEHVPVEVDHVLTTVLFTDIAQSTSTAAALGDERWRTLLDDHDRRAREELRRFRGREIKATGDGFLASFDSPVRAIQCARAITQAASDIELAIHAGLHTGECQLRGEDLSGLTVHIADRISKVAQPGEVLTSETVKALVAGTGIVFADRGTRVLPGLPGSWRLFAASP
jgi:class 3 adenylate cyclase